MKKTYGLAPAILLLGSLYGSAALASTTTATGDDKPAYRQLTVVDAGLPAVQAGRVVGVVAGRVDVPPPAVAKVDREAGHGRTAQAIAMLLAMLGVVGFLTRRRADSRHP